MQSKKVIRKPDWLKIKLPSGPEYERMRSLIRDNELATVCQQAQCPNQFECFSRGTATFMILGERCTRNCRFCAVSHKPLSLPDPQEPDRVAQAVAKLKVSYVVLTSVTRDDLKDGGGSFFARTINAIRSISPKTKVEVLIPDLQGNWDALETILQAEPNVLNHNIETVKRLYPEVRPEAIYERSLELLKTTKILSPTIPTKSGLMVGLGEIYKEIEKTMYHLYENGCDLITIGQYLQPSKEHLPVARFISPGEFTSLAELATHIGFKGVASSPSVRSSYEAELLYNQLK